MSKILHNLFLTLILSFFIISMAIEANDSNYPSCPSYDCNGVSFGYPFWMITEQTSTQFCGYHGLGIDCSDGPMIRLKDVGYHVRNITNTSITLVHNSFVNPNLVEPECPMVIHTIDLEDMPLNFSTRNLNLSFHFNCYGSSPDYATPIPCMNNPHSNRSYVNVIYEDTERFNWDCHNEVVTAVLDDVFPATNINNNRTMPWGEYARALINGFQLNSVRLDDNCAKCERSKGRCGYNPSTTEFMCFCSGGTTTTDDCIKGSGGNFRVKISGNLGVRVKLIIGSGSAALGILLMCIVYCKLQSSRNCATLFKNKSEDHKTVEAFVLRYGSLSTKRYKYDDIKKMTNSFKVELGQGGFGTVFKGKLSDGRPVAVKVLNSSKASGQEFINEVASIGRTSHVNIVSLVGFCFDYQKRALVYEFMPNRSLEKFIHSHVPTKTSEPHIGVDKLYEIALGIARGLDYLHRGCNTRILHLDIKPHNILLDEDFCPKIADFGLAKLHSRKESIVSMLEARGTIGYIAPEIFNRNFGGVSHKSDVYSYGMLLLEMVGGRQNVDPGVGSGHSSELYFPYCIYSRLKRDEYLLDSITTVEENDYARKMAIVGLWCIQTDPNQRPPINETIDMLEGSMDALKVPPKPFFSSPPRLPVNTSEIESESSLHMN